MTVGVSVNVTAIECLNLVQQIGPTDTPVELTVDCVEVDGIQVVD
jgi:hypothetical protein